MEKPRYEKLMTLNRIEANNLKKTISIIFIFNAVFLVLFPIRGRNLQNKKDANKNKTKQSVSHRPLYRVLECDVIKMKFLKSWDSSGYSKRTMSKKPTCQK